MRKKYTNAFIEMDEQNVPEKDWATTDLEREQARDMDEFCGRDCKCGGRFVYRPTCGCMVCTKCGDVAECVDNGK